jgi:hypothetical protein
VPVAEGLDGDPAAAVVGDGGQGTLGAGVVAAEVGPPQAGGQQQAGRSAAPMPMATIDSPRATITTRPWRSTKWAGAMRKPPVPASMGVSHSHANAAAHSR